MAQGPLPPPGEGSLGSGQEGSAEQLWAALGSSGAAALQFKKQGSQNTSCTAPVVTTSNKLLEILLCRGPTSPSQPHPSPTPQPQGGGPLPRGVGGGRVPALGPGAYSYSTR